MSFEVFADGQNLGWCRGCGARIRWAETVRGRKMPLEASSKPALSVPNPPHRTIEVYDQGDAHWGHCAKSKDFK